MSEPIASLDMYCWPETRLKWNTLWQAIRLELSKADISAPSTLTAYRPIEDVWHNPELLIGHCCGWPYISKLRDQVRLVGRFNFDVPECPPGFYNSVYIVPENSEAMNLGEALSNITQSNPIALNGTNSQSGFRVFGEVIQLPLENTLITGSHQASVQAVANGQASLAAIDAITWELAKTHEPAAQLVRVIEISTPRPGLPLITANTNHPITLTLFEAVEKAVKKAGEPLGISGFLEAQDSDYEVLL